MTESFLGYSISCRKYTGVNCVVVCGVTDYFSKIKRYSPHHAIESVTIDTGITYNIPVLAVVGCNVMCDVMVYIIYGVRIVCLRCRSSLPVVCESGT